MSYTEDVEKQNEELQEKLAWAERSNDFVMMVLMSWLKSASIPQHDSGLLNAQDEYVATIRLRLNAENIAHFLRFILENKQEEMKDLFTGLREEKIRMEEQRRINAKILASNYANIAIKETLPPSFKP
jgi:hypothetical protein